MAPTKAQIVDPIQFKTFRSRTKAIGHVEILLEIIKHTLESGEDVMISDFGKFCVKNNRKRRGGNPATGDSMILTPRRVVNRWRH